MLPGELGDVSYERTSLERASRVSNESNQAICNYEFVILQCNRSFAR